MDIGKFKVSPLRLAAWILIPSLLIAGVGLSSYALRLQSDWKLTRIQGLSEVLPRLAITQNQAGKIMEQFKGSEGLQTEDELMSHLQNAAHETGFTVNDLKVERRNAAEDEQMPVLLATVKGSGAFEIIEQFLNEVTASQHLLYASSLQVTRESRNAFGRNECSADITFELILFDALTEVGGAK